MLYDNVFTFPGLTFTKSAEQSKAIEHVPAPKVILASSGMSAGGRVLFHERNYLSDANNTLLFVGYQAPGTLGRKIQEGVNPVYIMGSSVTVRARIEVITGYSGHKDADHLLEFAHGISERIKKVYCVLGEAGSSATLAQNLRDNFDLDAVVPERRKAYELTRVM